MLISLIRPIGPVVIGISLGFTLSLLGVTWVEEPCNADSKSGDEVVLAQEGNLKGARRPNSISTGNGENGDIEEDFEPRIVPYKPVKQSQPKTFFR